MRTRMMLGVVLAGLLQNAVNGQTWDGGGTTNNWTDANNWSPNAVPANNGTAAPNFAGTTRLAPVVNVNFDVEGVTFDNAAGAFNIAGSGGTVLIVRGGGITNHNPSVAETFSVGLVLGSAQTWGGAGPLTTDGAIALGAHTLTLDSPATITLNNAVNGSGTIVKNGAGAVVFNQTSSFSGGITLNSGTLAVGIGTGMGSGAITINGGNVEATGGNRIVANPVVVNGDFTVGSGTALTFTGPVTLAGSHTFTNGITNLAISGAIGQSASDSELTLAGAGGTLALSGAALTLGTSLKLNAGTLTATGLINGAGHTLTQNAGTFTGSLINRGTFIYNGGTPTGNITNEAGGEANFNANLTLSAALNNSGTLRVAGGRTLTFGSQQLNNSGTIELAGGTLSANASASFASSGVINGFGTISLTGTSLSNTGQINVDGGNLTLISNISFTNSGTVSVPIGRQLHWNNPLAFGNVGLVQLTGGTLTGSGGFGYSNNSGGEIRGSGTIQTALTNNGGLVRATGTLPLTINNFSGHNTGGGELRVDEGATMVVKNAFNSSGTIVLGGPNASLNLTSVNNSGTVRGQGRVMGTALNSGVVRAEGGTLTFGGAGNTNTAAGRLEAGTGMQLLYSQGLAANAGLIALNGGAFDNSNVPLANSGFIAGYGTLRTGGLTNTGTISVGGTFDVLGAVINNGTVNTSPGSSVRFFGAVSGPGIYTGTGTVIYLNTFSPGASPAAVSFGGDVALEGAADLVIELGGAAAGSQYDTLAVSGGATLGGTLDVELFGGFAPAPGDVFQIISAAGGVGGKFASVSLPSLAGANWQLRYNSNAVLLQVALAGDYNFNGIVDAADFTLWQDSLGQTGAGLAADGDGDSGIDEGDYDVWKLHFGESIAGSVGGPGDSPTQDVAVVPEPLIIVLLAASVPILLMASFRSTRTAR